MLAELKGGAQGRLRRSSRHDFWECGAWSVLARCAWCHVGADVSRSSSSGGPTLSTWSRLYAGHVGVVSRGAASCGARVHYFGV